MQRLDDKDIQKLKDTQEKQRNDTSEQRSKHHKCFWTWPWGHIWGAANSSSDKKCVICSKIGDFHDSWPRKGFNIETHPDTYPPSTRDNTQAKINLERKLRKLERQGVEV